MATSLPLTQGDIGKLTRFHEQHFPNQKPPILTPSIQTLHAVEEVGQQEGVTDDLGFYDDGVKRTLTDDQVSMFRNSEVQRMLAERRRLEDDEREHKRKQARKNKRDEARKDEPLKRKFDDEAVRGIESLTYDDTHINEDVEPKTFLWPKLGT